DQLLARLRPADHERRARGGRGRRDRLAPPPPAPGGGGRGGGDPRALPARPARSSSPCAGGGVSRRRDTVRILRAQRHAAHALAATLGLPALRRPGPPPTPGETTLGSYPAA